MAPVISLYTCTRNPSTALFSRTLRAVAELEVPAGAELEYVIVDNRSEPSLSARMAEFPELARMPWVRVVAEPTPGTSAARRRAVRETRGELIVWVDDDIVLARDYLVKAVATANAHPDASVIGAGTIDVEFPEPVPEWVDREMRAFFQERRHARAEFGAPRQWVPYCPFGSGLVTRRVAMTRWSDAMTRGAYTLAGRDGRTMFAGEDAQVIFGAVVAGERIGVTPELRLTHLIPARRCTEEYIARMEYGLGGSLRIALAECFPGDPPSDDAAQAGLMKTLRAAIAMARARGVRQAKFDLAQRLGAQAGALRVTKRPVPAWHRALVSLLGIGDR